ncbi:hypothetical protein HMPREF0494_1019 [Limosilactobacillus antri DSM 16041]|uniref:Uncharacterized protein n=1 Tax=Limosilactobacillus antri DSM 16041 TaxID=525309 RepID=C8P6S5_9LACO|nr:hypothetical protein HMPREF0494_1019 [Limosilactobacillus antri DSM 16041]
MAVPLPYVCNREELLMELSEAKKKIEAMQQEAARFGRSL